MTAKITTARITLHVWMGSTTMSVSALLITQVRMGHNQRTGIHEESFQRQKRRVQLHVYFVRECIINQESSPILKQPGCLTGSSSTNIAVLVLTNMATFLSQNTDASW